MSRVGHVLALSCYALAAVAVLLVLPKAVAGLDRWTAGALALGVLLAGGLLHEMAGRRHEARRTDRRLALLRAAYARNKEELGQTRDELRRVYETLEGVSLARGGGEADAQTIREVAAEVRVLQALVGQLHATEGAGSTGAGPRPGRDIAAAGAVGGRGMYGDERGLFAADDLDHGDAAPLDEADVIEIVRGALRQDRVDLYLQPIVSLPQRKRRYYECFSRVRAADGRVILPEQYLPVARRTGLIRAIDNMLLFRCVQLLRRTQHHKYATSFFCNIAPHTIEDREFFHDFIDYLENCPDLAPSLVFEFSQADFAGLGEEVLADMRRLARAGYRFSVDQVGDARLDPRRLSQRDVHFVKIDAALLLAPESGGLTEEEFRILKARLDDAHIDVIVEKIETEAMLRELLDHNIDYGQGYLFGEPRLGRDPDGGSQSEQPA